MLEMGVKSNVSLKLNFSSQFTHDTLQCILQQNKSVHCFTLCGNTRISISLAVQASVSIIMIIVT